MAMGEEWLTNRKPPQLSKKQRNARGAASEFGDCPLRFEPNSQVNANSTRSRPGR